MQSTTSKILAIVGSVLFAGLIAFMVIWSIINWDVIKSTFNGSKIYTSEDVNSAYEDGYTTAIVDKEYYESLIKEYREKISIYTTQVENLTNQLAKLENSNNDYSEKLKLLTQQLEETQTQIKELQNEINYYKELLEAYGNINKLIVTFMYDNSVYDVVLCDLGATVTVTPPQNNEYRTFNYWEIDGEKIDLGTFQIQENTTIIANLTYCYDVKFVVEDETYNSQIITENKTAVLPSNPIKDGYAFKGWSIDRINVVDITTIPIIENTTFYAVFGECPVLDTDFLEQTKYLYKENTGITYFDIDKITHIGFVYENTSGYSELGLLTSGISVYYNEFAIEYVCLDSIYAPENSERLFAGCEALKSINFDNFNTSNVSNMSRMFLMCSSLTAIDFSTFDTSNVTNMSTMFYGCQSLISLDLSNFNTSNVTNMGYMFTACTSLTSLDLSSFNTYNVVSYSNMFLYDTITKEQIKIGDYYTLNNLPN